MYTSNQCCVWLFQYCIAGIFDGGNFDVFDAFQPDRQNLTCLIFKATQHLVKDSDHPSKYFPSHIWKVSIRQNFPLYGTCAFTGILKTRTTALCMQNTNEDFCWFTMMVASQLYWYCIAENFGGLRPNLPKFYLRIIFTLATLHVGLYRQYSNSASVNINLNNFC